MEEKESIFSILRRRDMTDKHKEKNKLTYLPWANAWAEVKSLFPSAKWDPVKSPTGVLYWTDGRTCWVETTVTIDGETQNETLAVMDYKNMAIPLEKVTMVDVEKSIRRCLTKNLALFGLDLNLWVGEEISDEAAAEKEEEEKARKAKEAEVAKKVKEVVSAGTKLINSGISKESMMEVVAKYNGGNGNPSSIKTIEVCEEIIGEFKKMTKKEGKE